MRVILGRGIFLFAFFCLLILSSGTAFASIVGEGEKTGEINGDDPNSNDVTEPQIKPDSTDVPDDEQQYDVQPEVGTFNLESELTESEEPVSGSTRDENYYEYEDDDEVDESSQSMMSFNFLYFLLQKFKFSDSLGY